MSEDLTVDQQVRMKHQDDLEICKVGGAICHGSLNEYHACRLNPGDQVCFVKSDGTSDTGVVARVWFYEGPIVDLVDGPSLFPSEDLVELMF